MNDKSGFSLIELLVTISIVGILCAVAYPIYGSYLSKTRRAEAQQNLLILSQEMEVYHTKQQSYLDATIVAIAPPQIAHNDHYRYAITELTAQSYQLTAIPVSADKQCGTMTLDQLGERTSSGTASNSECWLG